MHRARLRALDAAIAAQPRLIAMRTTRIYVDLELASDQELLLPAAQSATCCACCGCAPGAALTLFNGRGGEYAAELIGADRAGATRAVGAHRAVERESPLRLTLLQGIARGERMDLIVQKATELGVHGDRAAVLRVQRGAARCRATARAPARTLARGGDRRLRAVRAQSHPARSSRSATSPRSARASDAELRLMLVPQAPRLAGRPGCRGCAARHC